MEGYEWAKEVIAGYTKGQEVIAYSNPTNPSDAFLTKEYSFSCNYGAVFIGQFFLSPAILAAIAGYYETRNRSRLHQTLPGWFEVYPMMSLRAKLITSMLVTIPWHTLGVFSFVHYSSLSAEPYSLDLILWTAGYTLVGLIPAFFLVYYCLLLLKLKDARVHVNAERIALGDQLVVRCSQAVSSVQAVTESKLSLILDEKLWILDRKESHTKTTRQFTEERSLLKDAGLMTADTLADEFTFCIPRHLSPSSPPEDVFANRPRYVWYLKVATKVAGAPRYRAEFPLWVTAAQLMGNIGGSRPEITRS